MEYICRCLPGGRQVARLDGELAQALYDEGKNDIEIADGCRVSRATIRKWRNRCGLDPNIRRKASHEKSPLSIVAAEARAHGMNYGTYVAKLREGRVT